MKRFVAIVVFFFSLIGFAAGIFLLYVGETFGGVLGFSLGFSFLVFGMHTLKSSKLGKEIPLFLQNINAVPDLHITRDFHKSGLFMIWRGLYGYF